MVCVESHVFFFIKLLILWIEILPKLVELRRVKSDDRVDLRCFLHDPCTNPRSFDFYFFSAFSLLPELPYFWADDLVLNDHLSVSKLWELLPKTLHFWLKAWELSIRKKRKHAKHDVFRPKSLQIWELPILNVTRVVFSKNIEFYRRNVSFAFFSGALDRKSRFPWELMVYFAQMYGSFDF